MLTPIERSLLELREQDWERLARYQLNWLYYKAHQYLKEPGRRYTEEQKLFKHMRRVFDCVTHTVDTDARFTMQRTLRVDAEQPFVEDITDMWERSNFQAEKYKLVRYGANLGDAYLIVQNIGDERNIKPRIVVANSEDMTVYKDPDDQTQTIAAKQSYIFYGLDGKPHRRDWLFYPDRIACYTDEKMMDGYPQPHVFGEVPVIHIKLIDIGEEYGLSSWHNVQSQIDEVNELGSFSNRILLRYADPTLVGTGMVPGQDVTFKKGLNQDNIYFLPNPQATLQILEYQGNVLPQILAQMEKIEQNIKDQLPEFSLAKIREQAGLSGYAVSLHAAELIAKIEELRGNFANAIEWANALALRAIRQSTAPLEEFANRIVYEPILPEDTESTMRIWAIERDLGLVGRKELWRRQGLTEEEIEKRETEVNDELGELNDITYSQRASVDIASLERQLLGGGGL